MGQLRGILSVLLFAGLSLFAIPSASHAAVSGVDHLGPCTSASKVLSQADGKTLVVGTTDLCGFEPKSSIVVVRLNADGSPDSGFGQGGVANLGKGYVAGAAISAGGKLLVYGSPLVSSDMPMSEARVFRLDADGEIDVSFGVDGTATFAALHPESIAPTPDNGMVVTGYDGAGSFLLKLNGSGQIDPGFANGSRVRPPTDFVSLPRPAASTYGPVKVDSAGDIFIGFSFTINGPDGSQASFDQVHGAGITKIASDGLPDPSFGDVQGTAILTDLTGLKSTQFWLPKGFVFGQAGSVTVAGNMTWNGEYATNSLFLVTVSSTGIITRPEETTLGDFNTLDFQGTQNGDSFVSGVPEAGKGSAPLYEGMLLVGQVTDTGGPGQSVQDPIGEKIALGAESFSVDAPASGGVLVTGMAKVSRCISSNGSRFCRQTMALARYGADGNLDPTFGDEGVVTVPQAACVREAPPSGNDTNAHACQEGALSKPRVRGRFVGKGSGKRLVLNIAPDTKRPNRFSPWIRFRLDFPKTLAFRPGGWKSAVVRAGAKSSAHSLPSTSVQEGMSKRGASLNIGRSYSFQRHDANRIVIPLRAFKRISRADRGRVIKARVVYTGTNGQKATSGTGKIRLPR